LVFGSGRSKRKRGIQAILVFGDLSELHGNGENSQKYWKKGHFLQEIDKNARFFVVPSDEKSRFGRR